MSETNFFSPPEYGWPHHDDAFGDAASQPGGPFSFGLPALSPQANNPNTPGQGSSSATRGNAMASQAQDAGPLARATSPLAGQQVPDDEPISTRNELASNPRSKYGHLDWDAHKARIKDLYVEKNLSLAKTMKTMTDEYSFTASQKVYKDKIKEWGWQKNLPADIAVFMTRTAKKRKRETGRETIFKYGGKEYTATRAESTLSRAKKTKNDDAEPTDLETPTGVSYKTPRGVTASPGTDLIDLDEEPSDGDESAGTSDDSLDGSDVELLLSHNGLSRTDLLAMWEMVRTKPNEYSPEERERLLNQVLGGFIRLNGPTNDETNKVAFTLADFYVKAGRIADGDKVLERQMRAHLKTFGPAHKATRQHVLLVAELLNGLNRSEDALGLLSRAREMEVSAMISQETAGPSKRKQRTKAVGGLVDNTSRMTLTDVADAVTKDPTSASIGRGLGIARGAVLAEDAGVEALLLAIIRQCKSRLPQLAVQYLGATAELLHLYEKLDVVADHGDAFTEAVAAFASVWAALNWEPDSFQSFEAVEGALQLAANLVKSGFLADGMSLFQRIHNTALVVFGAADERLVWTLITIGLVYQTHRSWAEAENWFEAAFAAALASSKWDATDGICKSLQRAIDNHHFSYVSDEGRPFKSVFGVTGIIVRPLRLHMD